ncbi:MAG: endonuclease/exonuclease/phosphatase family protein, partial [Coriobacteriales bacterium]|nr:endonuclease/exonuclease/phosphatase family protein [Coriobacteriales bacterium]
YSWWSFRGNARANNTGWRIDYFLVSNGLRDRVEQASIYPEVTGSDHCPVGLILR